jgi:hypothetical protein
MPLPTSNSPTRGPLGAVVWLLVWTALALPGSAQAPAGRRVVVDGPTEQVIQGALRYLAAAQNGNGSWSASGSDRHEVAITGYVLMAFLAAGHVPDEGEFGPKVTRGINFLLNAQQADGYIKSGNTNMYGHGIAAIALAEVYGQGRDPRLKSKVEAAIRLIVNCQNAQGGWRYEPKVSDADISVTVLQVVALRCAKNAGLSVPQVTIDRAVAYVRSCHDAPSGGFTYQPGSRAPGFARTAAAMYSLQVCGQYDDPRLLQGLAYLNQTFKTEKQWFTYGNFYAAPAVYMLGGDAWANWYDQVRTTLLQPAAQGGMLHVDGRTAWWEPRRDSGRNIGPVYTTAVYAMILAMPYSYVPLYQR